LIPTVVVPLAIAIHIVAILDSPRPPDRPAHDRTQPIHA
jgi:hypothetical protein